MGREFDFSALEETQLDINFVKNNTNSYYWYQIYAGGRLLFADHIFDGHGFSKKDFLSQIFKSKRDYQSGRWLPDDFW